MPAAHHLTAVATNQVVIAPVRPAATQDVVVPRRPTVGAREKTLPADDTEQMIRWDPQNDPYAAAM